MKLDTLKLVHYRNYTDLTLHFDDGLTILTGENAQGKTNLLEAIFLLSVGRSHRTAHDKELIQWGQDYSRIYGEVSTKLYHFPLELGLNRQGKIAKFNHIEQSKLSHFIGKLNVILFAPEDMQLIKQGPSIRRKFIDSELGQANSVYLQYLLDYQKSLKQRNHYLKEFGANKSFDPIYFDILTDQLIELAIHIIKIRCDFISQLENIAQPLHFKLSNQRDELTLKYKSSHSQLDYNNDYSQLTDQFKQLFKQNLEREKERGITLYGPQRDDLIIDLNGRQAQDFASQGQQRTIILSLKLAEIEWMYQLTGEYPVLLLDDVLSELDDMRQHILINSIENRVQTFLTTASIEGINLAKLNKTTIYHIKAGQVIKGDEIT